MGHEFRSAIADFSNNVKDRSNAQVSCAGQFIGNHLEFIGWYNDDGESGGDGKDGGCASCGEAAATAAAAAAAGTTQHSWLHIDMAAPAYDKSSERATGYGVALLTSILGTLDAGGLSTSG